VRRFLTGVPFMMNIEVAPVSAIACVGAIMIAFAYSNFFIFCFAIGCDYRSVVTVVWCECCELADTFELGGVQ
jgi:hypothetical protein